MIIRLNEFCMWELINEQGKVIATSTHFKPLLALKVRLGE